MRSMRGPTRFPFLFAIAPLVALLVALPARESRAPAATPPGRRISEFDKDAAYRRFIWVTRWDFKSAHDIELIFQNAASARFTDVFFQVRGEGTLFCQSPYEPWAWELSGRDATSGVGVDPGWDPLKVAVTEAHRRGIRIHAWVNTMPGWGQKTLPAKSTGQHSVRHPEWFMVDPAGARMTANGFYACLDPGIKAVRTHLAMLMGDLVRRYDIDGLHLDYIRYPLAEEVKHDYSYNPEPLAAFKAQTGKIPAQDPEAWARFRKAQITAVVRGIHDEIKRVNPKIELSAATLADNNKRALAAQEPDAWLNTGIIDAVCPMAYVRNDMGIFLTYMDTYLRRMNPKTTWVGVWPRSLNNGWAEQVRAAASLGAAGVAIFSYEELFPNHKASERVVALSNVLPAPGGVKPAPPTTEMRAKTSNSGKLRNRK